MENGLLTYEMLKEISRAKKVREDKLKTITEDISHINASAKLSIVQDENYDDNVDHDQLVKEKAEHFSSYWKKHGLPDDVIKDLEIVEVGEGSTATANKWRERSKKVNERLKRLNPSQHEYKTASEDKGGTIVSDEAREFYDEPSTCERRGKDHRPIAYLRTSKQDDKELNSTDFIEFNGEKIPMDQLAWVYADIKLRGYTGKIRIIVDNGVYKSNMCNNGMSHVLDSVQDSDFGAVFMTTPNRAFDDAVAFQMMLEAETIYPGFMFHFSQDTGKNRMEGARKVTERKIRRQFVFDEYNTTVSGVDQPLVSTLSEPHLILHNFMKRAAVWSLTCNRLETVSSIQATQYRTVSPWIPKVLELMKNRKRSIGGSITEQRIEREEKKRAAEQRRIERLSKRPFDHLNGSFYHSSGKVFEARIIYESQNLYLGRYMLATDAAHAHDKAATLLDGIAENRINFATSDDYLTMRNMELQRRNISDNLEYTMIKLDTKVKEVVKKVYPDVNLQDM